MSLRSQLRVDLQSNITFDGDSVTLTDAEDNEYTVLGKVTRIEEQIDPDTGARFDQPVTAVTVSLADFDSEPDGDWFLATTDSEGNALTTKAIDRKFDRTLGFVKFYFEDYS